MFNRTENIIIPAAWQNFQIRPETVSGRVEYAGAIDGNWCVRTPSREQTIHALLRRVSHRFFD